MLNMKSCQDCSTPKKTPRNSKKATLFSISVSDAFDRVAVDVLGPFPASRKGNMYIVVFSDYLTRCHGVKFFLFLTQKLL